MPGIGASGSDRGTCGYRRCGVWWWFSKQRRWRDWCCASVEHGERVGNREDPGETPLMVSHRETSGCDDADLAVYEEPWEARRLWQNWAQMLPESDEGSLVFARRQGRLPEDSCVSITTTACSVGSRICLNIAGWNTWMPSLKAQGSRGSRFTANADADSMINGESTYLHDPMNHFLQALEHRASPCRRIRREVARTFDWKSGAGRAVSACR